MSSLMLMENLSSEREKMIWMNKKNLSDRIKRIRLRRISFLKTIQVGIKSLSPWSSNAVIDCKPRKLPAPISQWKPCKSCKRTIRILNRNKEWITNSVSLASKDRAYYIARAARVLRKTSIILSILRGPSIKFCYTKAKSRAAVIKIWRVLCTKRAVARLYMIM